MAWATERVTCSCSKVEGGWCGGVILILIVIEICQRGSQLFIHRPLIDDAWCFIVYEILFYLRVYNTLSHWIIIPCDSQGRYYYSYLTGEKEKRLIHFKWLDWGQKAGSRTQVFWIQT